MTRVGPALLAAALLVGCSSLQPNDAGVSNLQIIPPLCNGVELGTTLTLRARTFDQHGDSVDAPVVWRTADSVVDVNTETGEVTGLLISDTARVQALVGVKDPIVSDFIPLVVTPKADTLVQSSAARVTVAANAASSPALLVTVKEKATDKPVKAFPLVYRVVEPAFTTSDDRSVEFTGGTLALTACSSPNGVPLSATQLNRRAGHTQPDSAVVEVTARHPDGSAVPGSGARFTILFINP